MEEHLLQSQRNEVLALVRAQGFAPEEFRWQLAPPITDAGGWVPCLFHQGSPYYFKFEYNLPDRLSEFSPGQAEPTQRAQHVSWDAQLGTVERWLSYLRREREAPDLWGLVEEQGDLLGVADVENTPFTAEEQRQIAAQIEDAKRYVQQTQELSEAQLRELEKRLDYLVEASTRMPRLDWRNALVGALIGAIIEGVLPQQPVAAVVSMIARGLGALFGVDAIPELPRGAPPIA